MDKKKIKEELDALILDGRYIHFAGANEYDNNMFKNATEIKQKTLSEAVKKIKNPKRYYHAWYNKSCEMVRIFSPRRLEEFEAFYTGSKHIKKIEDLDSMTAGITHCFQELPITPDNKKIKRLIKFNVCLNMQRDILIAIAENFDKDILNLESTIQYGISKSEIDIAKELKENKHFRAAGAIAGVVIEVHLRAVATKRDIQLPINPQMKHYNEKLKGKAYDATITKQIELCSIIRNKCAHASDNPPTDDEINTIISIAEKIIATVN